MAEVMGRIREDVENVSTFLDIPGTEPVGNPGPLIEQYRAESSAILQATEQDYGAAAAFLYGDFLEGTGAAQTEWNCIGADCAVELLAELKPANADYVRIAQRLYNDFASEKMTALVLADQVGIGTSAKGTPFDVTEVPVAEIPIPEPEPGTPPPFFVLPPPAVPPIEPGYVVKGPSGIQLPPGFDVPNDPLKPFTFADCLEWELNFPETPPGVPPYSRTGRIENVQEIPIAGLGRDFVGTWIGSDGMRARAEFGMRWVPQGEPQCQLNVFPPEVSPPSPPTVPDCPPADVPYCPAGITAGDVRSVTEGIKYASTAEGREIAYQRALKLFGIEFQAGTWTSPADCPTEPTCPVPTEPKPPAPPKPKPEPKPEPKDQDKAEPPDWCNPVLWKKANPLEETPVSPDQPGAGVFDDEQPMNSALAAIGVGALVRPIADPVPPGQPAGPPTGWLAEQLNGVLTWVSNAAVGLIGEATGKECHVAYVGQFLWQLAERWTGTDLSPQYRPYQYWANYCTPTIVPSPPDADNMRLRDDVTAEQWEALMKMNGHCPDWAQIVYENKRSSISVDQAYQAYKMDWIKKERYDKELRRGGFIKEEDKELWEKTRELIPPMSDVIRFMMKDVEDAQLVERYKLDEGFEDSWSGPSKKAGEANGITPEVAKRYYRAAWDLPSPTQAAEMLHRLRPGRVPGNLEFTIEDYKQLLKAADYPNYFRERFEKISYATITRTDAERLHLTDVLNDEEYVSQMQDVGYQESDARTLLKFYNQEKQKRLLAHLGYYSVREAVSWFVEGVADESFLLERFRRETQNEEALQTALEGAQTERYMAERLRMKRRIEHMYMSGCLDETDARLALSQMGLDQDVLQQIVSEWSAEKACGRRHETAAQLCQMRERGLIGEQEQVRRLVRLGYDNQAALEIAKLCEIDLTERFRKELEKLQAKIKREQEAEDKKRKKEEKAAAKLAKCGPEKIKCPK